MKVVVLYEIDNVQEDILKGHRISVHLQKGGRTTVKVYNKKGKIKRVLHYQKVYKVDKEC
jgi:hypothetical protein